jgi:hypothetical protein
MKLFLPFQLLLFTLFFSLAHAASCQADPFEDFEPSEVMCCESCPEKVNYRHLFFVGPEIYHMERQRAGGKQCGWLYGVRVGYDRIKRYGWYWGFDALYASGRICGHSFDQYCLKSDVTDKSIEGRVGYTFQQKCGFRTFLTPYVGVGYFVETNHYKNPSPLKIHYETRYKYAAVGFLSGLTINPCWDVGVNFKAKILIDPDCKVTHDPEFDNSTQLIKKTIHYRVDVPITYHPMWLHDQVRLSLVPFYEYRSFGSHPNLPFDYLKTQQIIYGTTFRLYYCL